MARSVSSVSLGALFICVLAGTAFAGYPMTGIRLTEPGIRMGEYRKEFAPKSVPQIRSGLDPSELVFDLADGAQNPGPGRLVQVGDLTSFRALALRDIEMGIARVTLDNGAENPTHIHPRGTEMLYLVKGTLDVFIGPEAGSGMIRNTIKAGKFAVFPVGIPHGQKCVHGPCEFVAMFNSPEAGLVSPVTVG